MKVMQHLKITPAHILRGLFNNMSIQLQPIRRHHTTKKQRGTHRRAGPKDATGGFLARYNGARRSPTADAFKSLQYCFSSYEFLVLRSRLPMASVKVANHSESRNL
jgi:hypothetical protein